jgi:serine/threonine-protein kinase
VSITDDEEVPTVHLGGAGRGEPGREGIGASDDGETTRPRNAKRDDLKQAQGLLALGLAGTDDDPDAGRWSVALGLADGSEIDADDLFSAQSLHGRYVPGDILGRGGMGEVREVYDSVLDRDIAMKTAKVDSADMLSRFIQEARITSKLQHPNIPPVHDLGVGADGQHYFTMRRVRGDSLRHLIKKDSIGTLIERLQIFQFGKDTRRRSSPGAGDGLRLNAALSPRGQRRFQGQRLGQRLG